MYWLNRMLIFYYSYFIKFLKKLEGTNLEKKISNFILCLMYIILIFLHYKIFSFLWVIKFFELFQNSHVWISDRLNTFYSLNCYIIYFLHSRRFWLLKEGFKVMTRATKNEATNYFDPNWNTANYHFRNLKLF